MTKPFQTGNDLEQKEHEDTSHFLSVLSVKVFKLTVLLIFLFYTDPNTHITGSATYHDLAEEVVFS